MSRDEKREKANRIAAKHKLAELLSRRSSAALTRDIIRAFEEGQRSVAVALETTILSASTGEELRNDLIALTCSLRRELDED